MNRPPRQQARQNRASLLFRPAGTGISSTKRGFPSRPKSKNTASRPTASIIEIPLRAKLLSKSGQYGAIVASALVVDGGIYRHEFVSSAVIDALMRVQLETEVPIISAVLTSQNFHEHGNHGDFFLNHFHIKGGEAASACAAVMQE